MIRRRLLDNLRWNTGHELRTVWRRSKLKNKIWHSGHNRHIAFLKRTQKQVKIGYSVYSYKTTRIHWNNSCSFSRDLVHRAQWTSPPFCKFVPVINDVMLFLTTTVLSVKLYISLRPSKVNWINPDWCIAWRDCANFSLCLTTCFAGSSSWNQNLANISN